MKRIFIQLILFSCVIIQYVQLGAYTTPVVLGSPKKISIIGTGYVGLVLGACLADFGNKVLCADINEHKIRSLQKGEIPIYEPGLEDIVKRAVNNYNLNFTYKVQEAIQAAEVIFIAVDTPMRSDGQADLSAVKAVAHLIGQNLNTYKVICTKSTVPIGTGKIIKDIILHYAHAFDMFDIVSNPEFLKEGSAIDDFLQPYRVVVGTDSQRALTIMQEIYAPLILKKIPFLATDITTAETIKYASNSFLATKISYINEIAHLCEITGADIKMVAKGMGLDTRIGSQFLNPGPGFGGSCFPKDAQALLYKGRSEGVELKVLNAAFEANETQKMRIFRKLSFLLDNNLQGKTIAVLGLAFKANTDDVRCSPALTVIEQLLVHGAHIKAYDPVATENMKKLLDKIVYCSSIDDAVDQADGVIVLTEWNEFSTMNLEKVRTLVRQPIIMDARNILNTATLRRLGFKFDNVGNAEVY